MRQLPPGPRSPALVNMLRYARDPLGFLGANRERHGDIFTLRFPGFGRVVYVAEPTLVKELFTGSPDDLHAGEANATILEPAVGPASVLTLDGAAHMQQRKLLLAPFHGRAIEHYREVIRTAAVRDIETWPLGEAFALRDHMQRITLEVILRAVYGLEDPAAQSGAHAAIDAFTSSSDVLMIPRALQRGRFGPWGKFVRAREALDAAVFQAIAARRAAADVDERDDVLSLLMRSGEAADAGRPAGGRHASARQRHPAAARLATDQELRDELVTVVGAGHETTATALAWTVERLVRHPRVLARLRNAPEDAEYLDAVIKESLRVRPIIADVARKLTRALPIGGHELPAGTLVLAAITAVHQREDLYPDPHAFRPERWLAADAPPETYTWIPFGGGVRRCLGAAFAQEEMRIVLREIVARADLQPASPADERVRLRNITMAPRDGARVVLAGRRHAGEPALAAIAARG